MRALICGGRWTSSGSAQVLSLRFRPCTNILWVRVPLSGTFYFLAVQPLLHRLKTGLTGFNLPNCPSVFKLSAYADDVIVTVTKQSDNNSVSDFGEIFSAKVNWGKSEALMVGDGLCGVSLPIGLMWKKGGIKYLGGRSGHR